jgi:putative AlgH/UPF0301 family transcriptional regulator
MFDRNKEWREAGERTFLSGRVLISMPGIEDPRFERSIIYLCVHTPYQAMGVTLNRPIDGVTLADVLKTLEIPLISEAGPAPVLIGGPVERERGFVLHTDDYLSETATLPVANGVAMTATREVLQAIGGEAFLRPGFPQCLGHTEVSDLQQATASDVLDHRHPMLPCQGRKVRSCHVLGEPYNPEVSGMHLEDCRGCRGDGICIVREPGAIRGSDLNEGRTTLAHHIRHPESATDFHQVPSGHDHFAPARQFGKREEQGTGAVVHGNGIEGLRC